MTNYARIISGTAVDVSTDPQNSFHPTIAADFVEVPDFVDSGWHLISGEWQAPPPIVEPAPAAAIPPKVGVITYKMLFSSAERLATKASTDPVIVDLQELMNDPRTTVIDLSLGTISDALDYMTTIGLIAEGRKAEILTGVVR